jgi:nitrous oxidase accessory protein NosD
MRGDPGNQYQRAMGGSAAGRWTLQSYPGETATLTGPGFAAYSIQHSTFQNLTFIDAKSLFVGTADWLTPSGPRSHHIQIRNNTFTGPQARYGFIEAMFDNSLIEGNTIVSTAGGDTTDHGIYLHHGDTNTIRANTVNGVSGYGIHIYDERKHAGDKATSITNVLVEGNTLSGSRKRSGLIVSQGDDTTVNGVVIRNNIFSDNADVGIDLSNYGKLPMNNLKIHDNTIRGNAKGSITIDKAITALEIRNNTIDGSYKN